MSYLGKEENSNLEIINILKLVFLSGKRYNEIVKELKEVYGINLSKNYEEELIEMCNLSERYEQRIQQGIQQGIEKGKIQMAISMVQKYHLDLKQVLEENGISEKQYQSYLKEKSN